MTQKMKLEIIGPYTPDHEGPFCTRAGRAARILCRAKKGDKPLVFLKNVEGKEYAKEAYDDGREFVGLYSEDDLMNAREVPVAREFWDVVGKYNGKFYARFNSMAAAGGYWCTSGDDTEVIHVREVLPGEGA